MVGSNLKKIMSEKGISAKYLAEKAGVSPTHLSYVINGKRNISLELAEKIANVLDVPLGQFFQEDDNQSSQPRETSNQEEQKKPKDLVRFLEQSEVMFDGELYNLDQEDKQKIRDALEYAFWHAKQKNKRKKP